MLFFLIFILKYFQNNNFKACFFTGRVPACTSCGLMAEHISLPSEFKQLKEEEWADSCVDIGDEWVLDYTVQAHSRGGSGSDPLTEPFIQIPAIYILIHTLQSPVFREILLWEEGETQSSKQDKAAPQGADGREDTVQLRKCE